MRLKNRLAAEPINTGLENFSDLSLLETFSKRLAAGGVGLVTVFAPAVSSQARQDDSVIDGTCDDFRRWRPILETVHKFDCRAAVQLNHIGQDAASFYPISSVGGVSNRTGRTYHAAASCGSSPTAPCGPPPSGSTPSKSTPRGDPSSLLF